MPATNIDSQWFHSNPDREFRMRWEQVGKMGKNGQRQISLSRLRRIAVAAAPQEVEAA